MYTSLREALKRPIVNLELKIAPNVHNQTVNIHSDASHKGVAGSEKLAGVMRVRGMVPGTHPPCTPLLPRCHTG